MPGDGDSIVLGDVMMNDMLFSALRETMNI